MTKSEELFWLDTKKGSLLEQIRLCIDRFEKRTGVYPDAIFLNMLLMKQYDKEKLLWKKHRFDHRMIIWFYCPTDHADAMPHAEFIVVRSLTRFNLTPETI